MMVFWINKRAKFLRQKGQLYTVDFTTSVKIKWVLESFEFNPDEIGLYMTNTIQRMDILSKINCFPPKSIYLYTHWYCIVPKVLNFSVKAHHVLLKESPLCVGKLDSWKTPINNVICIYIVPKDFNSPIYKQVYHVSVTFHG